MRLGDFERVLSVEGVLLGDADSDSSSDALRDRVTDVSKVIETEYDAVSVLDCDGSTVKESESDSDDVGVSLDEREGESLLVGDSDSDWEGSLEIVTDADNVGEALLVRLTVSDEDTVLEPEGSAEKEVEPLVDDENEAEPSLESL